MYFFSFFLISLMPLVLHNYHYNKNNDQSICKIEILYRNGPFSSLTFFLLDSLWRSSGLGWPCRRCPSALVGVSPHGSNVGTPSTGPSSSRLSQPSWGYRSMPTPCLWFSARIEIKMGLHWLSIPLPSLFLHWIAALCFITYIWVELWDSSKMRATTLFQSLCIS